MNTPLKEIIQGLSLLAAATAFCLGSATIASATVSSNRGQLSDKDYKFATEALQGGALEVTLGQLAEQKATDPSVREFAQRLVIEHKKANKELTQLLTQKGASLPDTMPKKSDKVSEKLQDETGAGFDKSYIKRMVKDHKNDVEEFQKAAEKSDDTELKSWAATTLFTLQEHLRVAETVEKDLTSRSRDVCHRVDIWTRSTARPVIF